VVVECNPHKIEIIRSKNKLFVVTVNNFNSTAMYPYRNPGIDDLQSEERYQNAYRALQEAEVYLLSLIKEIISRKYGFMCLY
jgi:hypothetical protein